MILRKCPVCKEEWWLVNKVTISFRNQNMRLVASNPEVQPADGEEKTAVYGVPV